MPIKVHDDQSEMELSGPPPVRYPPRVLVGTLLESWSKNDDDGGPLVAEGSARAKVTIDRR